MPVLIGSHTAPLLHATPHGGDAWGIAILLAIYAGIFAAVAAGIMAVLAWRYRQLPGRPPRTAAPEDD